MSNLTREQLSSGDHKKNYGSVGEYLDDRSVRYELLQAPETAISMAQAAESLKLPLAQTLRTVLMKDEEGFLLVITSCDKVIDYPELCQRY